MKKFLLFIIFFFFFIYSQAQKNQTIQTKEIKVSETANDSCKTSQTNKIYEVDAVDQMPSFPGGPKKFERYLNTHVSYPVDAQENGIQGVVVVSFVVECDGSITNVHAVNSVSPSLNREAMRVISKMPRWTPGKINGSAVRVNTCAPVSFKIHDTLGF